MNLVSKKKKTSRPRHAHDVDPDIRQSNLRRLRRIEGQVRGLQDMVENDRYCIDILTQLSAAQEGLRAVGRELIRNRLQHCVRDAVSQGPKEADAIIEELLTALRKYR